MNTPVCDGVSVTGFTFSSLSARVSGNKRQPFNAEKRRGASFPTKIIAHTPRPIIPTRRKHAKAKNAHLRRRRREAKTGKFFP
ncbi:MAG: hypothetical protein D6714_18625 [Bacteroidetes bacterium]|nr:MAG: hypothetical protein D6714_18625 [Bacteroidota bacterium]